jgi:hypothetical protein
MSSKPATQKAATPATAPALDCRVHERRLCDLLTHCQPLPNRLADELTWPGKVRDISVSGVGLIVGRRFERGTTLWIELPAAAEEEPRILRARVAHATRTPDGHWLLGCALVSEIDADDLEELLHPRPAAPAPEPAWCPAVERLFAHVVEHARQRKGRRPIAAIPNVLLEGHTEDGVRLRLEVRRLVLTGSWPLERGHTLCLGGQDGSERAAGIRVRVEDCACQDDGCWVVAYSFAEPPSDEAVFLLGPPWARSFPSI